MTNKNYSLFSKEITDRSLSEAAHILKTGESLRETAKKFGVTKSTVHNDVSIRLKFIDESLHEKVKVKLENNFETRYIKGGEATKNKWKNRKEKSAV